MSDTIARSCASRSELVSPPHTNVSVGPMVVGKMVGRGVFGVVVGLCVGAPVGLLVTGVVVGSLVV